MTDASAPGKLVLVGEYAVLSGAPAIVTAVDVRARVKVMAIPGAESTFFDTATGRAYYFVIEDGAGLRWVDEQPEVTGTILEAVIAACSEHSLLFADGPSFRVSIDTDDFFTQVDGRWTKLGIGSSSAALVALVGALADELNLSMTPEEILAICHSAHRRFQGGSGSGADVATAVYGGVIAARRAPESETIDVTRCDWPEDLLALPIWSGVSASTTDLLKRYERFQDDNPDDYRRHLRRLKSISEQACVAWTEQSVIDVLNALAGYDDALLALDADARIGISSEPHDRIRQLVEQQGAIYKTSGAGGGDFGLALTDSAELLDAVRVACRDAGFEILDKPFLAEGLIVT